MTNERRNREQPSTEPNSDEFADLPTQSSASSVPTQSSVPAQPSESNPSTQGTEPCEQDESTRENGHKILRTKLASIIAEYRDKRVSKPRAISQVSVHIDDHATLSKSEKETAVDLCIEQINSIIHDPEPRFIGTARPQKEKTINDSVRGLLDDVSGRPRPEDSGDDFSEQESDDPDERPRKKRKAKESEMGWFDPDDPSPYSELESCRKTCKRLQAYNKDISGSKFLAKLSRRAPSGIPSSQWERILRGEVLDLDHFLSSLHRTTINEEGETRIGNAKISLGVADAKRRVSTAAEWSSAWHLASRAIAFAFPHRAEELRDYGDFIEAEFSAKLPSSHPRIILFDIAIRNIVQGGHNTLLTDRSLHLRFYSAILMPDGVAANNSTSANRRSNQTRAGGSKSDICNRFNTSTGCPSSDFECKYKHICKNCKKAGHGKDKCPK
jgi:hypothetical protein